MLPMTDFYADPPIRNGITSMHEQKVTGDVVRGKSDDFFLRFYVYANLKNGFIAQRSNDIELDISSLFMCAKYSDKWNFKWIS